MASRRPGRGIRRHRPHERVTSSRSRRTTRQIDRPAAFWQPSRKDPISASACAWAIGLLAAAAVQGAGALTGGLALTSPASFATRALIALAIEGILATLTIAWLHRIPAGRRPLPGGPRL